MTEKKKLLEQFQGKSCKYLQYALLIFYFSQIKRSKSLNKFPVKQTTINFQQYFGDKKKIE
jgi:hypothetical protein